MDEVTREALEERLADYPIFQMAWLKSSQIAFKEEVRTICKEECPRYGKSWACPPAVGTVSACAQRCKAYNHCFIFSTLSEVEDITDMEETLKTRMPHEKITHEVAEIFREAYGEVLILSTESCAICKQCTYPDAPCRHPEHMFPSVESHGIVVTEVAEEAGMDFMNGSNVVTWFSLIFFQD